MKFDGEIVHLGAKDPKTDRPKSSDLIAILKNSFRDLAKNNQCKATALVYNVVVPLSGRNRKSDAIQVCLDHVDNYSAEVFFPYRLGDKQIVYRQTLAQKGKNEIFETIPTGAGEMVSRESGELSASALNYSFFGSSSSSITRLSKRPAPPPSMLR
jgi:hypothetical protein